MQEIRPHSWKPATAPLVRLALERWGITEAAMDAMLQCLNDCDNRIAWSARGRGESADLVVHVVDPEGLAGPSIAAAWNLMGPVEALRADREAGMPAIALVKGHARHLPLLRLGCWVVSGHRDLMSAACILAGAAMVPAPDESVEVTRRRLAELASLNVSAVLHRAVATSASALASTLQELLESVGPRTYTVPSHAYIGIGPDVRVSPAQDQVPVRRILHSQGADTEADVMLTWPWPDLYGSWRGASPTSA